MKLNEGYFSFRTAIIHCWDKSYQEINFKSHLNSALHILQCNWKMPIKSHRNIFVLCEKIMSDLNRFDFVLPKMSDFVSFQLFGFTLSIKVGKFDFESHWIFLIKTIWHQIWICPIEKCLILFHFHCLGSL